SANSPTPSKRAPIRFMGRSGQGRATTHRRQPSKRRRLLQHPEGRRHRLLTNLGAADIAEILLMMQRAEAKLVIRHRLTPGDGEMHKPDRLFRRTAAWAGNAGDRH